MSFMKVFGFTFTVGMVLVMVITIAEQVPVLHLAVIGAVAWLASKIGS